MQYLLLSVLWLAADAVECWLASELGLHALFEWHTVIRHVHTVHFLLACRAAVTIQVGWTVLSYKV